MGTPMRPRLREPRQPALGAALAPRAQNLLGPSTTGGHMNGVVSTPRSVAIWHAAVENRNTRSGRCSQTFQFFFCPQFVFVF